VESIRGMKLRFLKFSQEDMQEIKIYITSDNQVAAIKQIQKF
jgi:hypothetical protein